MTRNEIICGTSLSIAWAEAFLATMRCSQVSPLVVTVTGMPGGCPAESEALRELLDSDLNERRGFDSNTVANTIFPASLWNPDHSRHELFSRYRRILPGVAACNQNRYGVYFQRLIDFKGESDTAPYNQLEHIINTFKKGNHRFSGLQASIFDPTRDHTDQRMRGFPCLQQVGFHVLPRKKLAVFGFYPKQHLYERGYGNYLGLCRLGQFMAHEMGLTFVQMTCFVGVGVVSNSKIKKAALRPLAEVIKSILGKVST